MAGSVFEFNGLCGNSSSHLQLENSLRRRNGQLTEDEAAAVDGLALLKYSPPQLLESSTPAQNLPSSPEAMLLESLQALINVSPPQPLAIPNQAPLPMIQAEHHGMPNQSPSSLMIQATQSHHAMLNQSLLNVIPQQPPVVASPNQSFSPQQEEALSDDTDSEALDLSSSSSYYYDNSPTHQRLVMSIWTNSDDAPLKVDSRGLGFADTYPEATKLAPAYRNRLKQSFNSYDIFSVILKPEDPTSKIDLQKYLRGVYADKDGVIYQGATVSKDRRSVITTQFFLGFEEFNRDKHLRRKFNDKDLKQLQDAIEVLKNKVKTERKAKGMVKADLTLDQLSAALDRIKKTKDYTCEVCGKKFKSLAQCKEHLEHAHAKIILFFCPFCFEDQTRNHSTHYHMCCHLDVWKFGCKFCPEGTDGKFHRHPSHLNDHTIKYHLICVYCDGLPQFPNKAILAEHINDKHHKFKRKSRIANDDGKPKASRNVLTNEQSFDLAAEQFNWFGDTKSFSLDMFFFMKEEFESLKQQRYNLLHGKMTGVLAAPEPKAVLSLPRITPVGAVAQVASVVQVGPVAQVRPVAQVLPVGQAEAADPVKNPVVINIQSDSSTSGYASSRSPSPDILGNGLRVLLPKAGPKPSTSKAVVIAPKTPSPNSTPSTSNHVSMNKRKAVDDKKPSPKKNRVRGFGIFGCSEKGKKPSMSPVFIQRPAASTSVAVAVPELDSQSIQQHATFQIHTVAPKPTVVYLHDLAASTRKRV